MGAIIRQTDRPPNAWRDDAIAESFEPEHVLGVAQTVIRWFDDPQRTTGITLSGRNALQLAKAAERWANDALDGRDA